MIRNRKDYTVNGQTITIQIQKHFPSKNPHTGEETQVTIGFDVANGDRISIEQYNDKTLFSRKPNAGMVQNIWL